jgi:bacterioferritin-associated ferredoxin
MAPAGAPRIISPMLVCQCCDVTECELREASASGASLEDVLRATGAGSGCGVCRDDVFRILAGGRCGEPRTACHACPARACGGTH